MAIAPHGTLRDAPEVVVVAYGTPALVRNAIAPLAAHMPVTVVDNSSMPEIEEITRELDAAYLDPGSNVGFAAAVNWALDRRQEPSRHVLLLNPDAVILPADVELLGRALERRPKAASVTSAQNDAEGRISQVSFPFPTPKRFAADAIRLAHRLREPARYVVGSVLLLRSDALDAVGRFDERFFLYFEETDWEYRAHLAGWTNEVVDEARALHVGAATCNDSRLRDLRFQSSQEKYLRKHFGAAAWQLSRAAVVAESLGRAAIHRGDVRDEMLNRARLNLLGPAREERRRAGTSTAPVSSLARPSGRPGEGDFDDGIPPGLEIR